VFFPHLPREEMSVSRVPFAFKTPSPRLPRSASSQSPSFSSAVIQVQLGYIIEIANANDIEDAHLAKCSKSLKDGMGQQTMQQTVPSQYIDKRKLEELLLTRNGDRSVTVTRKLDKYNIKYHLDNPRLLNMVRARLMCGQATDPNQNHVADYIYI